MRTSNLLVAVFTVAVMLIADGAAQAIVGASTAARAPAQSVAVAPGAVAPVGGTVAAAVPQNTIPVIATPTPLGTMVTTPQTTFPVAAQGTLINAPQTTTFLGPQGSFTSAGTVMVTPQGTFAIPSQGSFVTQTGFQPVAQPGTAQQIFVQPNGVQTRLVQPVGVQTSAVQPFGVQASLVQPFTAQTFVPPTTLTGAQPVIVQPGTTVAPPQTFTTTLTTPTIRTTSQVQRLAALEAAAGQPLVVNGRLVDLGGYFAQQNVPALTGQPISPPSGLNISGAAPVQNVPATDQNTAPSTAVGPGTGFAPSAAPNTVVGTGAPTLGLGAPLPVPTPTGATAGPAGGGSTGVISGLGTGANALGGAAQGVSAGSQVGQSGAAVPGVPGSFSGNLNAGITGVNPAAGTIANTTVVGQPVTVTGALNPAVTTVQTPTVAATVQPAPIPGLMVLQSPSGPIFVAPNAGLLSPGVNLSGQAVQIRGTVFTRGGVRYMVPTTILRQPATVRTVP